MKRRNHRQHYLPSSYFGCVLGFIVITGIFFSGQTQPIVTPFIPEGFEIVLESPGVLLSQKLYAGGYPDFVQIIDLDQGAKLKFLHGDIVDFREGKGMFGGNDASFKSQSLNQYWFKLASMYRFPFCVSNGQFFYMQEYPTRLPFPLKVNGTFLTEGYARKEYVGQKLILELWDDHADIKELNEANLNNSSAPNIIAGLTEDARKSPSKYVARTFIGISDQDDDEKFEIILIFNSQSARQIDAANVLKAFGAQKVMMLDGGGSTQLVCRNVSYIESERIIPQALGIVAAGPAYSEIKPTLTPNELSLEITAIEQRIKGSDVQETEVIVAKKTIRVTQEIDVPAVKTKELVATIDKDVDEISENANRLSDVVWILLAIFLIAPFFYFQIYRKHYK